MFICTIFLDCTCKGYHIIFVFLWTPIFAPSHCPVLHLEPSSPPPLTVCRVPLPWLKPHSLLGPFHPQTKVSPPLGHGEFPSLGVDPHPTPRNSSFLSCPAPHTLSSPAVSSIHIIPSLSLCLTHHILSPTFWGSPMPVWSFTPYWAPIQKQDRLHPPKLFLMGGKDILADNNNTR